MHEYIRPQTKKYLSTWMLAIFFLLLLGLGVESEFFHHQSQNSKGQNSLAGPIKADILANIKMVRIQNRFGTFSLALNENGNWQLLDPRPLPVTSTIVHKILSTLSSIRVKGLHQYDPINLANFSLDRPLMSIRLFTKLDDQVSLNFGIINPITDNTYMTVEGKKSIYQIDILKNKLEALELSDFVDSKVFAQKYQELESIAIFRGSQLSHKLTKDNSAWNSSRFKQIDQIKTAETIQSILDIKAHLILDQTSEEAAKVIDNYLKHPYYKVEIQSQGKTHTYYISALVKDIPDVKLEKKQYVLINSDSRKYPYLINKDYLNIFELRYQDFR